MSRWFLPVLLACLVLLPASVRAQGVLIDETKDRVVALPRPDIWSGPRPRPLPQPVASYKIKSLDIRANVTDQVAKVQLTQSFVNTGSVQMEVSFLFPLPYDGAIDRMTFLVDGKEYEAKLLDAKQARSTYEAIVRRNQDPALLEWMGTGMFKTSVFPVPPGAERKVTLSYTQLCRKDQGLTDFVFPLSTAKYTSKPVETVNVNLSINSASPIKNVYSPSHQVEIKRPDNNRATVSYTGKDEVPAGDFRLVFDTGSKEVGTSVITYRPEGSEDGYLLLLASPEIKAAGETPQPKTVVIVVDRSGSMSGEKIEQAKGAVRFVLNNLRDGDLFNIVTYDSVVESFKSELQRYNDQTRKQALAFVEDIYAGGSTNISGALKSALTQLTDKDRPSYVIFLTDGLPTTGETNEAKIVVGAKEQNQVRARVMAFGVGYDVNSRLLDKLVSQNHGQSEYVRPKENIETRVASLYRKIRSPMMTDVEITFDVEGATPEQGTIVNRVYPAGTIDLFTGQQLVLVARYKRAGDAKVTLRGKVLGQEQTLDFPAKLAESSADDTYAFVEKLWATRRVGELIDEMDLVGRNEELVKELVTLSMRHGILTPYTSFFADDGVSLGDVAGNVRRAGRQLEALEQAAGESGFAQRAGKAEFKNAAKAPAADAFGGVQLREADKDRSRVVHTVRNVGNKTFYYRDNRWVDSTIANEAAKDPQAAAKDVVKVERYSKEYFDLVEKLIKEHGRGVAKYLAIDGPVTIRLGETTYQF